MIGDAVNGSTGRACGSCSSTTTTSSARACATCSRSSGGVQVLGEAADGAEAVRLVRELAPDVVVMDLNMPKMSGVEATRHITAQSPLTRVIVLTISDQDADVMDAIVAGACGYLLKDASIDERRRRASTRPRSARR